MHRAGSPLRCVVPPPITSSTFSRLGLQLPLADQTSWFREEVQPHEAALRAWLRSEFPSLPDVDDIVQESYFRLLRARETSRIESTRAYLFGIARHVALGAFRKERMFPKTSVNEYADLHTLEANNDVVAAVNLSQEFALAGEAIKTLPDRCRQIVTLRALHDLSYPEIAARLGLAEETVRVQMARGLRKCAHYLREHGLNERRPG